MKTTQKGFTLIELLVVIAIIGILAGMVLVSMGGARSKARDAKRLSDLRQIISAQEMFYGSNDQYYTNTTTLPTSIVDTAPDPDVVYLTVPAEPGGGDPTDCGASTATAKLYQYCTANNEGDPQKFCYWAQLENPITNKSTCTSAAPCHYATATHSGTFYKSAEPTGADAAAILADCASGVQ